MGQRIKGQEVVLDIISPSGRESTLGDVVSASITYQLDILKQRLLGETSDRKDDIFRGLEGEMELQLEQRDALRFVDQVKDRATRRTAASSRFSVTMTLNFPEGGSARIQMSPVYFGNIPLNVGGGDEYVTMSLTFESEDGRILFVNS
jgi:hypothetical protein